MPDVEAPVEETAGSTARDVVHVRREDYLGHVEHLRDEGWTMVTDLTAVDYLGSNARALPDEITAERFEVVVNLIHFGDCRRMRIRVQVPDADPTCPSLFQLYPGTEAMEREVWDMFGIAFAGHPDLTRILMPEDWEGHPLRKDFAIGRVPVQFKAPRRQS